MGNVTELAVLTVKGKIIFIPQLPLLPMDCHFNLYFQSLLTRHRGCLLNIVKLKEMAIFSHGQLYVGCSRMGSLKYLFIFSSGCETKKEYNQV